MVGMPAHRDIPIPTVISLMATVDMMKNKGIPFELQLQVNGSIIEWARSKVVDVFVNECDKNRLFWIDSDISWKPEDFMRLLALSTKYPVVGAVYPAKQEEIIFYIQTDGDVLESNEDGLLSIRGLGLGFTVVHRHVIEKLHAKAPELKMPYGKTMRHMFRCDSENGEFRGEDMAFFSDVKALGYPVLIDPTVVLGHVGPKVYTASFHDLLIKEQEKANGPS